MKQILISTNYGCGWSTWNSECPECLYHPDIVTLVEAEATSDVIEAKAKEIWPDGYWGAASDLEIYEVEEGVPFHIHEYDGSESVKTIADYNWITL